ncbi:hypothetical protein [Mangrovicella endophytica]|uniref:hypothetical protein n=1 Tax=Mangrovicella endophytica TaxID=2066697 RepID=UPI000C9E2818|nr:hypothetical protein [Mangrovicella endophytica]
MPLAPTPVVDADASASAVSWGAIIAGAVAAAVISLVLMLVGSGLGMTMVSPFSNEGVSATTFAVSGIIWLVIVQWLSSGLGGYLTGRLRTRWAATHSDEVYFRDSAHGFLAWALATILVAGLLSSAVSSIVGGGVSAVSNVAAGAAQGGVQAAGEQAGNAGGGSDPTGYFVDTLFRTDAAAPAAAPGASATGTTDYRGEATRILARSAVTGELPDADKAYLATLVARETGQPQDQAQARVDQVIASVDAAKQEAKEAADTARSATATLSLLTALSLVIGAFIAGVAAIFGGRERDDERVVLRS